ncbi:MAG: hypothetical protein SWX82_21600 [Cyanobacteriota bacterium]|nr:hypothetical protein [Cyanobacteriota bacterium]
MRPYFLVIVEFYIDNNVKYLLYILRAFFRILCLFPNYELRVEKERSLLKKSLNKQDLRKLTFKAPFVGANGIG